MAVLRLWEEIKILNFTRIVDPKALHKHSVHIPVCAGMSHRIWCEEPQASGVVSSGLYRIGSQGNEAVKRTTASSNSY